MAKVTFSKHFIEDRSDRFVFIATTVGIGEIVHTHKVETTRGKGKVEITSTGVIIVRGYGDVIITMYIATLAEIKKYYDGGEVHREVFFAARRNEKRGFIKLQNQAGARARA